MGQATDGLIVALLAILLGAWTGSIDPTLNFNPSRVLVFSSSFLIAWAALFELGGPGLSSWDGQTLSEIVHPRIFQTLFLPGTLGLLCATVL